MSSFGTKQNWENLLKSRLKNIKGENLSSFDEKVVLDIIEK